MLREQRCVPAVDCIEKLVKALEDESIGIVAAGTSDTSVGAMYVPQPDATLTSIDMNHVDGHLWGWRYDLVAEMGCPTAKATPIRCAGEAIGTIPIVPDRQVSAWYA